MQTLNANQAKTQFGDLLLKVQRSPVQINKNGKPVAVVLSVEEYQELDRLKLQLLKEKIQRARQEVESGELADGEAFISALLAGQHDGS